MITPPDNPDFAVVHMLGEEEERPPQRDRKEELLETVVALTQLLDDEKLEHRGEVRTITLLLPDLSSRYFTTLGD